MLSYAVVHRTREIGIRLALGARRPAVVQTILADTGGRYQSKLFNPAFMRAKNLPLPDWLEKRPKVDLPFE